MAAPILSLEEIRLRQGEGLLFDGLSLFVDGRDRLALVGRNGAGKTTLLRIISAELEADAGRRSERPGLNIVRLSQDPAVEGFATLADFAAQGPNAPPMHAIEAIASQLGLDLATVAATSSGGERRRAALARAIADEPDLLLLDEPTNHLDLQAIDWLEGWLSRFAGAFIVVSHDRTFLTRLTRACIWLDRGTLRRQEIGFGGFDAWMEAVYAEEAKAADKLDSKIAQELHWLQRGVTARRRRNQGRLERLHQMRAERRAMLGVKGVAKLDAKADDSKTRIVIDADNISKSFAGRQLIRDFSIRIQRGDRIGIVGPNGAGKTTLLRLLTGEIEPDSGTVTRAKTLSGILVDQQRRLMEPTKRVRDILADGGDWIEVRGARKHVRGYLTEFMFPSDAIDARIGTFSGGEQSRLLLAREFARESNLLVLDEPTNDLDIETLDLLQEVIADYEGTVLIVSHDRDFLDRTTTMVIGLDGHGHTEVVAGGYRELEAVMARRRPPAARTTTTKAAPKPSRIAAPKLSFAEKFDLERLPAKIEAIERQLDGCRAALSDPGLYTRDPARVAKLGAELERLEQDLQATEARWLEVAEKAEKLGAAVD